MHFFISKFFCRRNSFALYNVWQKICASSFMHRCSVQKMYNKSFAKNEKTEKNVVNASYNDHWLDRYEVGKNQGNFSFA